MTFILQFVLVSRTGYSISSTLLPGNVIHVIDDLLCLLELSTGGEDVNRKWMKLELPVILDVTVPAPQPKLTALDKFEQR